MGKKIACAIASSPNPKIPPTLRVGWTTLFDADPDVFVLIAHDLSVRDALPYFPAYLTGWKASGLKEPTVW
ncbi:hypothetical protein B0H14DRAFT_2707973, partial [Mycena olivaceomarginata]